MWYVVRTISNKERFVAEKLTHEAETFYPHYEVKRYKGKRRQMVLVEQPLFPSYIFSKAHPSVVAKTQHALGVIKIGTLSNKEVDRVRAYNHIKNETMAGQVVQLQREAPYFGLIAKIKRLIGDSHFIADFGSYEAKYKVSAIESVID
jgi:transcription antitermination factor NusG